MNVWKEELQEKYDIFNLHKGIKETTNRIQKHQATVLRGTNNEINIGIKEKPQRWKESIEKLYDDNRRQTAVLTKDSIIETGLPITKSKEISGIKREKTEKQQDPKKSIPR